MKYLQIVFSTVFELVSEYTICFIPPWRFFWMIYTLIWHDFHEKKLCLAFVSFHLVFCYEHLGYLINNCWISHLNSPISTFPIWVNEGFITNKSLIQMGKLKKSCLKRDLTSIHWINQDDQNRMLVARTININTTNITR